MQTRSLLFCITLSFILSACSSPSENSNNVGQNNIEEAQKRWPEKGHYSYKLSRNGCETQKKFEYKYEYCLTLTDSQLNNGCALKMRQRMYENNCGNDFSQVNIKAPFISGWDAHIQRNCALYETNQSFTEKELCFFLKDESRHDNCHWQPRKQHFDEYQCLGDFSQRPPKVETAPIPQPPTSDILFKCKVDFSWGKEELIVRVGSNGGLHAQLKKENKDDEVHIYGLIVRTAIGLESEDILNSNFASTIRMFWSWSEELPGISFLIEDVFSYKEYSLVDSRGSIKVSILKNNKGQVLFSGYGNEFFEKKSYRLCKHSL